MSTDEHCTLATTTIADPDEDMPHLVEGETTDEDDSSDK